MLESRGRHIAMTGCPGPVWQHDDLIRCFQRDYLQTVFPLVLCGLSILVLSVQIILHLSKSRAATGYHQLSTADRDDIAGFPRYRDEENEEEAEEDTSMSDSEDDVIAINRTLSLQRTRSNVESVITVDQPKGKNIIIALETAAVTGEVGIHILILVKGVWGNHDSIAAGSSLAVWIYILTLTVLRLFLSNSTRPAFSKLWNHTAVLYSTLWILSSLLFRTAIIHPRSTLARIIAIVDFALTTILLLIAVLGRKGNKAVILEFEGALEPSREPLASVFSRMTFSWVDPIVMKGYKKTFELADIWNLMPKDKAAAILAEFRQTKKTSRLAWHLLKFFKGMLLVQAAFAMVSGVATFAPTLLIKAILEYIEDPSDTPSNAAWFYVILLFVTGCVSSLCDGQALWVGRKICIRLRAIIIGEIYAKALRRKAAAGSDTVLGDKADQAKKSKPNLLNRLVSSIRSKASDDKAKPKKSAAEEADTQVNTGTIINLMAVDSFKVSEISAYLHFLWASVPVQIIIAVVLLYQVLGYSSIAGIGTMVLLLPINIAIAKQFSKIQKKIMAATDARIHSTNEVLQNVRIIKFFAWEERFGEIVNEKRAIELKALRNRYILWACAATIWYGAPIFITFLSFFIYTVIEKKDLIPSIAFTALSLFSLLRIPLDQFADMLAHVQESKVSVDRVEEFLNEEETEKYTQVQDGSSGDRSETLIGLQNATFTWGGKDAIREDGTLAFRLLDIDVQFRVGQLNIIAGPTGSGKTSLLMAMLGEMTLLSGSIHLPGCRSREDLKPNPETGMIDAVAYCAQQAWLVNDTIKQNILFSSPWDAKRYKDVLHACSLERDLEILGAGDETMVGEKGITLSGGQKQRVSLARALYCNSRHVLLDDCLSAVDSETAKWIFDNCIMGPLMYRRTCILVTHNITLCVPQSQYVVVLENGKLIEKGEPEKVIASGALGDEMQKSRSASKANSRLHSRVPSQIEEEGPQPTNGHIKGANGSAKLAAAGKTLDANANTRTEAKAEGGVKWRIIQLYLAAMGPWWYWVIAAIVFAGQQLGNVSTNIWIREWANSYQTKDVGTLGPARHPSMVSSFHSSGNTYYSTCFASGSCPWNLPWSSNSTTIYSTFTTAPDKVDVGYYLGIYVLLGVIYLVIALIREGLLFAGSLSASWKIHKRLLASVTRAKFSFFDSTPLGQLMNRFSKDLEAVDQEVAPIAIGMLHCLASVVTIVILISIITPGFLIAGFFISFIYFFIGKFYIRSSRDLKRIESVQRSPLYQQFGETLSGVTTIRAYGDERRFIRDNIDRVNTHNRPFIYLWATNRWLSIRIDVTGALVAFFAGAFVILSVGKIDAGAAGLSLSYAVTFTENVLWLVRLYAINEQNMNSVERIKEYLDVEQEAPEEIAETRPEANWPSRGAVEFIGYTTRYRSDLDPVLRNISFTISPREKVGIVGRTGAGKSSLALALFRGLEAEDGKILVDGVDIGLIGLRNLRESITIVPQDPTLFTGTIRSNLDPFDHFSDEAIFSALRRVQLIDVSKSDPAPTDSPTVPLAAPTTSASPMPADDNSQSKPSTPTKPHPSNTNPFLNLSSPITESGSNLSQGQRQLLCLARAMLKTPKVLLMDEATASIDYATDSKIQAVIRDLDGTVITIAHRLKTVVECDKVLVLDKGEVVEFAHPWDLIKKEGSVFKGMCEVSGEYETLEIEAKKAWEARNRTGD